MKISDDMIECARIYRSHGLEASAVECEKTAQEALVMEQRIAELEREAAEHKADAKEAWELQAQSNDEYKTLLLENEALKQQLAEAQKLRDKFRAELINIVNARMSEFDDHGEFFHWARNRARHALGIDDAMQEGEKG